MDNTQSVFNDPQEFIAYLNQETQKILDNYIAGGGDDVFSQFSRSWTELITRSMEDPSAWINAFTEYQKAHLNLWQNFWAGLTESAPVAEPSPGDRRFNADEWSSHPIFNYIKQSYLLSANLLKSMAGNANLDVGEQKKLEFYTQQYIDAMSPTNFAATNPEVLQHALDTQGQSLLDGLKNLLADIEKGRISMTDESAFTLGENIATTEGSVVFECDLFQLIHYKPLTEQVYEKPTLIIPPCINKFYILDLQPHNSFVRYCVEQGQNVFLISWANPTPEQGDISWDDYVGDGVIRAIDLVREITDVPKINTVAWCIGGTLLSTALAVLADRKVDSVGSATFLTTLTDFEDAGDLCVFIDETQVKQLEGKVKNQGYLSGKELATSFNLLRSNDLIWSYVVNNYLKGQTPPPFDILYWNSDSTNLPAEMYTYYLKNMYLENKLSKPNALTVCGSKVDLGNIKIPCYFLSTIEDHIAPWKGTFKATETFGTDIEFTLGASGHVAGVINPVSKNRRHYWVKGEQGKGPEHWLETAERQEGSWWANWQEWLRRRAGKKVDAPTTLGDKKHAPIEAAPGRYVAVRIN
jgi:polyhydroxyalkanoate synthase